MDQLRTIKPLAFSQCIQFKHGKIPTLKRHNYAVQTQYSITGDAPKQFIRVYEYGPSCRKDNKRSWPLYIAKTAYKWYPTESIMEYLLNRIGVVWGLEMADSRLVRANGQIRFLSKYFLSENTEELSHGADILAGYFNDKEFINEIEQQGKEREFINVQVFREALKFNFPNEHKDIFRSFVIMLLFDALVGNNDRHFYNYGVIRDLTNKKKPRFSPIYDTARGLFWNKGEKEVLSLHSNLKGMEAHIQRYVRRSMPKIGWEGHENINHFMMVRLIKEQMVPAVLTLQDLQEFFSKDKMAASMTVIDQEFNGIISPERLAIIKRCLHVRLESFNTLLV